jgi:hypothetical protein
MAFTPRSGKNAQVRWGANVHTAKKWTVTFTTADSDTTNFEGGGYGDVESNTISCDITIEFDFDATNNPWDAPLSLQAGNTLINLKLYLNLTTGPFWLFPSVKCLTAPTNAEPKAMLNGAYTFRSKGTFTPPTGAF